MTRRLLNLVTGLSLLVCVAAVVTWARSFRVGDCVSVRLGPRVVAVTSEGGCYACSTFFRPGARGVVWSWGSYAKRCGAARAARSLVHFGFGPESAGAHDFVVPQWIVPAIFGALPAARMARWSRRRRAGGNACRGCGYDLTGNASGVCPECGSDVPPARPPEYSA